jgi:hypothetical protein
MDEKVSSAYLVVEKQRFLRFVEKANNNYNLYINNGVL